MFLWMWYNKFVGEVAEWSIATVLKTVNVKAFAGSNPVLSFLNTMTQEQAQTLKNKVEELNKLYAPMVLFFDMFRNPKEDHDDNWFVTIVYHVTPDDWFTFVSLGFNFEMVSDKLNGYQFAMEAVLAHLDEHDDLQFSHSDLPLGN